MDFIFVSLGGAVGAGLRYAISLIPIKLEFPILTLVTNILGAILIGFIVGLAEGHQNISSNTILFWKTGVCGGFTTFSTFSLETVNLFERRAYSMAAVYCIGSVIFCILGILIGRKLSRLW